MQQHDYYYLRWINQRTQKPESRKCQIIFTFSHRQEALVYVFDKQGRKKLLGPELVSYKDLYASEAEMKMIQALNGVLL